MDVLEIFKPAYWLITFTDSTVLLVVVVSFLIGGSVKGLIGGGLPSIVVPVMALFVEPAWAAAVTLIPVMATNIWQAVDGNRALAVCDAFGHIICSWPSVWLRDLKYWLVCRRKQLRC